MKYTKPNLTPDPASVRSTLGKNIHKLRKSAGLSQMALAIAAGVELSTVHRVETGKTDTNISTMARFRVALDCQWKDLLKNV